MRGRVALFLLLAPVVPCIWSPVGQRHAVCRILPHNENFLSCCGLGGGWSLHKKYSTYLSFNIRSPPGTVTWGKISYVAAIASNVLLSRP